MSEYTLTRIVIYPVKSFAGMGVPRWEIGPFGFKHDREWMLVNSAGRFLSQRKQPQMSQFSATIEDDHLHIWHVKDPQDRHQFPLDFYPDEEIEVSVWGGKAIGLVYSNEINEWISERLGREARLVRVKPGTERKSNPDFKKANFEVVFQDGFPFLLMGYATLDDLNNRLGFSVPMNRFRPNLVFSGGAAFDEDTWDEFKIGEHTFYAVKPCSRCILINVDQVSGEATPQPLNMLSTYRKVDGEIMFGQNLVGPNSGMLKTGDEITVVSKKKPILVP